MCVRALAVLAVLAMSSPDVAFSQGAAPRTLVVVAAHADDETPVAPILARYAREGVQVYLIIATGGGAGAGQQGHIPRPETTVAGEDLVRQRAEEARCASQALGIQPPILLGFPDGKLGDYIGDRTLIYQVTQRIAEELARLHPDAVITWGPDGGTGHPDHRIVSNIATQLQRAGAPGVPERVFYMNLPVEGMRAMNPPAPGAAARRSAGEVFHGAGPLRTGRPRGGEACRGMPPVAIHPGGRAACRVGDGRRVERRDPADPRLPDCAGHGSVPLTRIAMRIISFATAESDWKSPRMGIILHTNGRDSRERLDCEKLFAPAERPANPLAGSTWTVGGFSEPATPPLRLERDASALDDAREKGWLVPSQRCVLVRARPATRQDRLRRTELPRPRRGKRARRSEDPGDLLEVLELRHRAGRGRRHSSVEREGRLRGRACGRHRSARVARERRTAPIDHVLGYTAFNDVTARDFQFGDGQWQRGKSCDTFAPMGQTIVTTDEIPDPHALRITLTLNGVVMQDSNTSQMIFRVPEIIEFITNSITLEPGDVIATGTPAGVGVARKPPVFLKPGDRMEVEVEHIGELGNPVEAGETHR